MIDPNLPIEWEDGTPAILDHVEEDQLYIEQPGDLYDEEWNAVDEDGNVIDETKPGGYYNILGGGYAGAEDVFMCLRNRYDANDYKDDLI